MQEPYHSIQEWGEATHALVNNPHLTPEDRFLQAQTLFHQLTDIKQHSATLESEWTQYITATKASLHHQISEARSQISPQTATQLTIKARADKALDRHTQSKLRRTKERRQKDRFKILAISCVATLFILAILAGIGFYQWNLLMSNEGWFHDARQERWTRVENRIRFGKSIETADHAGRTAFIIAATTNQVEALETIKSLGADIHAVDHSGKSALHHAAAAGQAENTAWLISQGLDINLTDQEGISPLHFLFQRAAGNDKGLKTYELLMEHGAQTNTASENESLLMAAVLWVRGSYFQKNTSILEKLIERGADVNYRAANGGTALSNAMAKYLPQTYDPVILRDSDEIVRLLLDAGATYKKEDFQLPDSEADQEQLRFLPTLR